MLKRINKKQLIFVSIIAVLLFLTWSFTTLITRAYDRFSDTGVQLDNTRTLTIKSKDVANAFDTFTTSSLNFETSARAESLPAVTTRAVKFKITKLEPASGYKEVLPRVEASYTKAAISIYVSNNVGAGYGDIKLLFNGPYNIERDLPNTKGTEKTTGAVSLDVDGAGESYGWMSTDGGITYAPFTGNRDQKTELDKLAMYSNNVDGAYMIELIDATMNQWRTIVEIPTIKNSDSEFRNYFNNFGLTEHINYDPIVYAKVKEKVGTEFNSYANAFAYYKSDSTTSGVHHIGYAMFFRTSSAWSVTDLQNTGAFNSDFVSVPEKIPTRRVRWGNRSIIETFPNTLTVTMDITRASDYYPDQYFNLGMQTKKGFSAYPNDLALTTILYDDKYYDVLNVRPIVMIRNLSSPDKTKVFYIKDPSVTVTDSDDTNAQIDFKNPTLPAMYSNYDPTNPSILRGKGGNLTVPFAYPKYYQDEGHFYLRGKMGNLNRDDGLSGERTIRGEIVDYILTGKNNIFYESEIGNTDSVNTENLTSSAQIFSETSNLKIEFGFTADVLLYGKHFSTGNQVPTNGSLYPAFEPWTIGLTNEDLSHQSPIDVATFSDKTLANVLPVVKSMGTEALFTTSQYNAYKVDQNRNPLNDAGFAIMVGNIDVTGGVSGGDKFILLNKKFTSTAVSKMITESVFISDFFEHPTPSSIPAEYYFTSGAIPTPGNIMTKPAFYTNGAIIIHGLDPYFGYKLYEIKPPEGYKRVIYGSFFNINDIFERVYYTNPALYLSWPEQAAYSMNTDFYAPNNVITVSNPGMLFSGGAVTEASISAMRMQIFINVPELGLPNTGGIALGIILILGIASVSTGLYVRKRSRLKNIKRLIS